MALSGRVWVHEQEMRTPFGISRGTDSILPTVLLELDGGGIGEGSPVRYKGQRAAEIAAAIEGSLATLEEPTSPIHIASMVAAIRRRECVPSPALAAIDTALHDRLGRRLGLSVAELLGQPIPVAIETSYTISLADTAAEMASHAAQAATIHSRLKVKLGKTPEFDLAALRAVKASAPHARIAVDANCGWSREDARFLLPRLADEGVAFVEQPLALGDTEGWRALRSLGTCPLFADEELQNESDLERLAGCIDGINIKLMKCGGISGGLELKKRALGMGLRVMFGCMIETSVGIAAAAHICSGAEWCDLDGALLTRNDPYAPLVPIQEQRGVVMVCGPGLGVTARRRDA